MTILVFDNGNPERKHSTVLFFCKIDDVNDNTPTIDKIIVKTAKNFETSAIKVSNLGNATVRIKHVS